ncbi:ImcF-related family protein [Lelliottia wanjuensis]|uniref:ImcF-related family protein n=1 Tax=Lelliottia wanjuensis TaxID=3050585 RepID=UPI003306C206
MRLFSIPSIPFISFKKPENRFLAALLLLLIVGGTLCWLVWQHPERLGLVGGTPAREHWLLGLCTGTGMLLLGGLVMYFSLRSAGRKSFDATRHQAAGDDIPVAVSTATDHQPQHTEFTRLKQHLRSRYGFFWRYKVRMLLVVGEDSLVSSLVPTLKQKQWLEGERTVLIDGGSLHGSLDVPRFAALRLIRRSRPFDAVVWALSPEQSQTPGWMDNGLRTLQQMGAVLRFQPSVWLWQVCDSLWSQDERVVQPVGVQFPQNVTSEKVVQQLQLLLPALREQGLQQVFQSQSHDFLLRLGHELAQGGIAQWRQQLAPWLAEYARRIPLRGLMFSLPLATPTPAVAGLHEHRHEHSVLWQCVADDSPRAYGKHIGLPWEQGVYHGLLVLILLWGLGSVVAFTTNRHQMVASALRAHSLVNSRQVSDAQLMALQALRNDIGRLQQQNIEGAPWYLRFGLNHNPQLLERLWMWYGPASQRLIRDAAAQSLHQKLTQLANLPPDSLQRATMAKTGYDQLKAYLMMVHPEKAQADFFSQVMKSVAPQIKGISPGLWQSLAPDLWSFYAANLPTRPDWKISPDNALIAQTRQVLLGQIGRRNADNTVYQAILTQARRNYADMTLEEMTGDTDARQLFTTDEYIPGVFTRRAWEEAVQPAIEKAVTARRDEIDWVLSDNRQQVSQDVLPEVLQQRLTERYFSDFSATWLRFLNSVRWNKTQNLSDVTDQLTLMSDVRQSPLIALMNTLAEQGQTGRQHAALSDSLIKSAKELLADKQEEAPVIDQKSAELTGPLDKTFGPLLMLMGKAPSTTASSGDNILSLQTYLTRVTRVRLKLQQIADAAEPQEMMQLLAQTVFRGKSVDLTDSQEYGSLVAASLGAEWSGFGQTMFVQPLKQSWQAVLEPAAASLNDQWRDSVVNEWDETFAGRYPFADSDSDVSLPALADFIRQDSGRIDQFLTRELDGLLHKEGHRWVVNTLNTQGLTVNPAFLKAVNQLGEISGILYPAGSQGIHFELRARPAPDVVETMLTIDGQKLHYFNQMESWQGFRWPGDTYQPGTQLTWTSIDAGARLQGNYPGSLGLIRWLAHAETKQLDESRWQLTLTMPDTRKIRWILRTERGSGPLALLKLQNFRLPAQIFGADTSSQTEGSADEPDEVNSLLSEEATKK